MDESQGILQGAGTEPIGPLAGDIVRLEREKYEKVWKDPRYRRYSPGEGLAQEAFVRLGMERGDTLIDYGCGTGRALRRFIGWGLDVMGFDIAENCLEEDVHFVRGCLWDLPPIKSRWAYCTDVMEHIPEQKVDDVLRGISERSEGAYFQIALRPDSSGPLIIGEQLHLTVKGSDWWGHKLRKYWDDVDLTELSTNCKAVCRGPR